MHDTGSLSEFMALYYRHLFPVREMCQWLVGDDERMSPLDRRELSFTLADDVYIRFQSFRDAVDLRTHLLKKCPVKIDIGAVYNYRPRERSTVAVFEPVGRELVFDIDMSDYDDVRTCCSSASVCARCWRLVTMAVRCIDAALRDDFGFERRLWVFSGRRGVHCWVCDPAACQLSGPARAAVAEYLQIVRGGLGLCKKVSLGEQLHPMVVRAVDVCKQYFGSFCLDDQDVFGTPERHAQLLKLIPDETLRRELSAAFEKLTTSREKWNKLTSLFKRHLDSGSLARGTSVHLIKEIILQYTYPRLDIEVSKGMNHLLKAPFCVHPKTGRVCVPIDLDHLEKFDPFGVPTIWQLETELSESLAQHESCTDEYPKTSLTPYVARFTQFVNATKPPIKNSLDNSLQW